MPAVESPLVIPGVPLVPFVTGPYEPLLLVVVIFGQGQFPCGRSLPLEGSSIVWKRTCHVRVCFSRGQCLFV